MQARRRHPAAELHGREDAAVWLDTLQLVARPRWHVELTLEADPTTRFRLDVYAEEWGFAFHHAGRASWIRVTDVPFVHGRDDFSLLLSVPELLDIKTYMSDLEAEHGIELPRATATVRSNIPNATERVQAWLATDRRRRKSR